MVFRRGNRGDCTRNNRADDGNGKRFARGFKRDGGRSVARENHDLRAVFDEKLGDVEREMFDFCGRSSAVRNVRGIGEIQQTRVRQGFLNAARNRQSANAGIAHADGETGRSSTRCCGIIQRAVTTFLGVLVTIVRSV